MSRIGLLLLPALLFAFYGCAFENGALPDMGSEIMPETDYAADRVAREEAAREVAFKAKSGMLPLMPELYWGKYTYYPSPGSGCYMTVIEKDLNREEVGSYEINICGGEE